MNHTTTLLTLAVFTFTMTVSAPALAGEHKGNKEMHRGDNHMKQGSDMHRKHKWLMQKWRKEGDHSGWKDWGRAMRWHDASGWKRGDRKQWGRHGEEDEHGDWDQNRGWDNEHGNDDDEEEHDKHSIHELYKKAKYKLEPSERTKQDLSDLYYKTKIALIEKKAEKKKRYFELKRLKHRDEASASDVMSKIDELYSAKAELMKARVRFKMELKDLLTEEQWMKLKDHGDGGRSHHGNDVGGDHDRVNENEGDRQSDHDGEKQ